MKFNQFILEKIVYIESFTAAEIKNAGVLYFGNHFSKLFGEGSNSINRKRMVTLVLIKI